jgi:hypothetical protein
MCEKDCLCCRTDTPAVSDAAAIELTLSKRIKTVILSAEDGKFGNDRYPSTEWDHIDVYIRRSDDVVALDVGYFTHPGLRMRFEKVIGAPYNNERDKLLKYLQEAKQHVINLLDVIANDDNLNRANVMYAAELFVGRSSVDLTAPLPFVHPDGGMAGTPVDDDFMTRSGG